MVLPAVVFSVVFATSAFSKKHAMHPAKYPLLIIPAAVLHGKAGCAIIPVWNGVLNQKNAINPPAI